MHFLTTQAVVRGNAMRTSNSKWNLAEKKQWAMGIVFLLCFPAYAQSEDKRLLLVSIPDRRLAVVENGAVRKIYPVAVGKDSTPSPTGSFHVVVRVTNPTYYHQGKVVEPGPQNPLGTRWMGLDTKGYGIHGTNAPNSIGKAASHGCIRMAKRDLEELFSMVKVGDTVEIRGERDEQVAQIFGSSRVPSSDAVVVRASAQTTVGIVVAGEQ